MARGRRKPDIENPCRRDVFVLYPSGRIEAGLRLSPAPCATTRDVDLTGEGRFRGQNGSPPRDPGPPPEPASRPSRMGLLESGRGGALRRTGAEADPCPGGRKASQGLLPPFPSGPAAHQGKCRGTGTGARPPIADAEKKGQAGAGRRVAMDDGIAALRNGEAAFWIRICSTDMDIWDPPTCDAPSRFHFSVIKMGPAL